MAKKTKKPKRRGRPPLQAAASHDAILDAVYDLVRETSVRDLTMEAVARRANVGKPTLYKWWPTKGELVLAMFRERIAVAIPPARDGETAEHAIGRAAGMLIKAFSGELGRVTAGLVAEGQSEPAIIRKWFDEFIRARRDANAADIERGKATGELSTDADAELIIDAVFGAIYYRLLFGSAPLTQKFGRDLVAQVFRGVQSR